MNHARYIIIRVPCSQQLLIAQSVEHQNLGQRVKSSNPETETVFTSHFLQTPYEKKIVNIGESSKLSLSSNVGGLLQVMPNANGRTNTLAARGLVMRVNVVSW